MTMNRNMITAMTAVGMAAMATSCRTVTTETSYTETTYTEITTDENGNLVGKTVRHNPQENRVQLIGGLPAQAVLRTVVFKMSGDYSHNVPLTLNGDGTLASYPDPKDITANSAPVQIANGWWIDRRGVTTTTVFSSYTLEEYAALEQAPSTEQLLQSIIPGACVTALERLKITPQEALADTAAVNELIANRTISTPEHPQSVRK
jgi:hypothetical protein